MLLFGQVDQRIGFAVEALEPQQCVDDELGGCIVDLLLELDRSNAGHVVAGADGILRQDGGHQGIGVVPQPSAVIIPVEFLVSHAGLGKDKALLRVEEIHPGKQRRRILTSGGDGEGAANDLTSQVAVNLLALIHQRIQQGVLLQVGIRHQRHRRGGEHHAIEDFLVLFLGGVGAHVTQSAEAGVIQEALLPQLMQPGQQRAILLRRQHLGDRAVLVHRDVVIVGIDAECMAQEPQIPHAGEGQRDLVIALAVAVHIPVTEDPQHLGQLLGGGGHAQACLVQPGLVDPHGVVELQLVNGGQRSYLAGGQRHRLHPFRMRIQQRPQVRRILLQVGLEVDDLAGLQPLLRLLWGKGGLEEHIGQLHRAGKHLRLGSLPGFRSLVLHQVKVNASALLHALEEQIGLPVTARFLVVIASHGKDGLRISAGKHRQHQHKA